MSKDGWTEFSEEEKDRFRKLFPSRDPERIPIRLNNGFVTQRNFVGKQKDIYNFQLRDNDIWVVTYPRSGTTWTLELVWMLINDVDIEKGKVDLRIRCPFLERDIVGPRGFMGENKKEKGPTSMDLANQMEGRRILKTHAPLELLPPDLLERCKVVYVGRNPKDNVVSRFKISESQFAGTFDDFLKLQEDGLGPSYWNHLLSGWSRRNEKNMKFIWFEDMKADTMAIINELCDFLEHPLTEDQKIALNEHVKLDNMKKNEHTNHIRGDNPEGMRKHIRKGQVGDWQNYFNEENSARWDKWIAEKTKGTGLESLQQFQCAK